MTHIRKPVPGDIIKTGAENRTGVVVEQHLNFVLVKMDDTGVIEKVRRIRHPNGSQISVRVLK